MTNYSEHYKTAAITNGGIFPVTTQFSADQLATPVKDGCKFEGWYTDASFSEDNKVADNATAVADTTYYAKWSDSRDEIVGEGSVDFGTIFEGQTPDSQTVTFQAKQDQEADPLDHVDSASGNDYFTAEIDGMKVTISPRSDLTPGTYRDTLYVYTEDNAVHFIDVTLTVVGYEVSGSVESFLSDDTVTIQLIKQGRTRAAYETTVSGGTLTDGKYTADYSFPQVPAGTYTMKVSKANHVTREYTVTVGKAAVTQDVQINLLGDVNCDGAVDIMDYQRLLEHIQGMTLLTEDYPLLIADVNRDSAVDIMDFQRLLEHIQGINPLF